jgi:hypothetical protein
MSFLENEKRTNGLDLNTALTDIDSSASWAALIRDDYEMFELMLKRGAQLELAWTFTSRAGATATTKQAIVCLCHDRRFFEILLHSGFPLNEPLPPLCGEDGRAKQLPLQLLFETYAQLEAKDDKAKEKLEASIAYLISSGADVNKDNPDGESAVTGSIVFFLFRAQQHAHTQDQYYDAHDDPGHIQR